MKPTIVEFVTDPQLIGLSLSAAQEPYVLVIADIEPTEAAKVAKSAKYRTELFDLTMVAEDKVIRAYNEMRDQFVRPRLKLDSGIPSASAAGFHSVRLSRLSGVARKAWLLPQLRNEPVPARWHFM